MQCNKWLWKKVVVALLNTNCLNASASRQKSQVKSKTLLLMARSGIYWLPVLQSFIFLFPTWLWWLPNLATRPLQKNRETWKDREEEWMRWSWSYSKKPPSSSLSPAPSSSSASVSLIHHLSWWKNKCEDLWMKLKVVFYYFEFSVFTSSPEMMKKQR